MTEYVSELLNRCKAKGPQHSISSKSAKSALLIASTTSKFIDSVNMNQMLQSEDISQFVDSDWTDYEFLVRLVGHGKLCFLPEYGKGLSIKVARAWFTLSTFKVRYSLLLILFFVVFNLTFMVFLSHLVNAGQQF